MKLLGYCWFGGRDTIGVVYVESNLGEKGAFIGVVKGENQDKDIKEIADWGSKFDTKLTKELIKKSGTMLSVKKEL